MPKIFSNYAKYYDLIYSDKPYKKEADFVYKWAKKPKTILELGCGTGQHAKYLCKKSLIFGIDISQEMLDKAYRHKNIYYALSDIDKNLLKLPKFTCILAMFNVLGYVLLEDCIQYLPIQKGGYFIFDVWDAKKMAENPPKVSVTHFKDWLRIGTPTLISKRLLKINYKIVYMEEIRTEENHYVQGYYREDIEKLCEKMHYKISGIKETDSWTVWYKLQKL